MNAVYYLLTRAILALAMLMSADALLDTALAAEPTHILAAFALITIAEVIIEANTQ